MISAGCTINGTVINSVLAPGVVVEKGAVVKDSILFTDCVVETGAAVNLAIFDKRVHVGAAAVIGAGNNHHVANRKQPTHLYTGITLLGKEAVVPSGQVVGRNCIISSHTHYDDYPGNELADGESV
jgi:glucose-1-phosphate adenylyltransferase